MKLSVFVRVSTCLALCLTPALLSHCGGATDAGLMGTETGNPPVVDGQKLRLALRADGAELIGEPGAVSPGARVSLHNRSTGVTAEVTAGADGSFSVLLAGSALDTYEVTVSYQGGTVTLSVSVASPEEIGPSSELSTLACQQLESALGERMDLAFAPAASGCTRDSECVVQYGGLDCYSTCDYYYVLGTQRAAAIAAAEQSIAPVCTELESRCEQRVAPVCDQGSLVPVCNQGTCQGLSLRDVSCEDMSSRAGTRTADAIDTADRTCNSDTDCQLFSYQLGGCSPSCDQMTSVAVSAWDPLVAQLATIDANYCRPFVARACPSPPLPTCAPPPGSPIAVCQAGQCGVDFAILLP